MASRTLISGATIIVIAVLAMPLMAKDERPKAKRPPPAAYNDLKACQSQRDSAARLVCYDAAMAKFDTAVANSEIYMIDKQQVSDTRKTLFGLPLPRLGLFGSDDPDSSDANSVDELAGTIKSVGPGNYGSVVTLEDGSVWEQIDGRTPSRGPEKGMKITIVRAALGSYKMMLSAHSSMKVKRLR